MKEAIANEQVFLQMLFKKNEKMLQILAEDEMLKDLNEAQRVEILELKLAIKDEEILEACTAARDM